MKKKIMALVAALATSSLMAGGDFQPKTVPVASIPAQNCNANKVYSEKDVDLMWQDAYYTDAEHGAFKREYSLGKAGTQSYAASYCQRLSYAGHMDWRLPTSEELTHVHRKEGQVFENFTDNDFWSSTPTERSKYYVVFPADAMIYARVAKQSNYIRCVRCTK